MQPRLATHAQTAGRAVNLSVDQIMAQVLTARRELGCYPRSAPGSDVIRSVRETRASSPVGVACHCGLTHCTSRATGRLLRARRASVKLPQRSWRGEHLAGSPHGTHVERACWPRPVPCVGVLASLTRGGASLCVQRRVRVTTAGVAPSMALVGRCATAPAPPRPPTLHLPLTRCHSPCCARVWRWSVIWASTSPCR